MIVIADDITGAAELAGIAFDHGQTVRLLCGCPIDCDTVAACGTTVIATDTRSMTEVGAAAETRRLVEVWKEQDCPSIFQSFNFFIFKKTDSALRGHVVAELQALMEATGYRRAVYLPANPSKGRIIRDGVYYIREVSDERLEVRDVPIHETAFSYDPEFPARTSVLKERFPDAGAKGIIMPDAESEDDIRRVIAQYDDGQTLFAGAADLFTALLEVQIRQDADTPHSSFPIPPLEHTLILCGSTQSKPLDIGIPVVPMPRAVYDGEQTAADWLSAITPQLSAATSLILTIPHTHRTGKAIAVHLRTVMAEMARLLVTTKYPLLLEGDKGRLHLIIEGGATAWATLQALGWTEFEIQRQVAPGVVQMSATNGTLVTLKPGSYPWGGLF